MSDFPFPLLVAFLFLVGGLAILTLHMRRQAAQRALPLRDEYLARHGQSTPACTACGSALTREFGQRDGGDPVRIVACAHCDRLMFRYTRANGHAAA